MEQALQETASMFGGVVQSLLAPCQELIPDTGENGTRYLDYDLSDPIDFNISTSPLL